MSEGCEDVQSSNDEYDYDVLSADRKILTHYNTALTCNSLQPQQRKTLKCKLKELTNQDGDSGRVLLRYSDITFLHKCLKESCQDDTDLSPVHLYELMDLCSLRLPSPPSLIKSAEYVAKMKRLRLLADEAEYQRMTKDVSPTVKGQQQESIGKDLKQMDSQVTFLLNFVLTVVGAFVFGYKAVEYSLATPNLSLQLTVGVTLATVVFFADIYFIIKKYV